MTNVLILSYHCPPHNTSAASRIRFWAKYLPAYGIAVSGIRCGDGQDEAALWQGDPTNVVLTVPSSPSTAARIYQKMFKRWGDRLPWMAAAASAVESHFLTAGIPHVIISSSPPLVNHIVAMKISKRARIPWIADFQDPLAHNPFHNRLWDPILDNCWQRLIFDRADCLVANTDTVLSLWRTSHPKYASKMLCIWNGFDPSEDIIGASMPCQTSDHLRIVHIGDIYDDRHPLLLMDSLTRLSATLPVQPELILIGPLQDDVDFLNTESGRFLRERRQLSFNGVLVDRQSALREMINADALLLLDLNRLRTNLQVPAKLYDYVRSGRPILAFTPRESPTERLLRVASPTHIAVDPSESAEAIDTKVRSFLQAVGHSSVSLSEEFRLALGADTLTRSLAERICNSCV